MSIQISRGKDIEKLIISLVTYSSKDEATKLSELLVSSHLAACVNIIPVHSIYEWKEKLERQDEWLLIIKSVKARFEDLKRAVIENHTYENPEIISLDISDASEKYAAWIEDICR